MSSGFKNTMLEMKLSSKDVTILIKEKVFFLSYSHKTYKEVSTNS